MFYVDFFSDSPKTYIFQKKANKTNFGGFLFIIYMIIMFFISLAYILDYIFNEKYTIEYSRFITPLFHEYNKHIFEPNSEISFKFKILNHDKEQLPKDEFILFFNQIIIDQDKFVKSKLSNFFLKIYYNCQNKKCEQITSSRFYYLKIEYNGYELYHQNNTFPPLQMNENKTFIYMERFNFDFPSNIFLKWEKINYEEEKGVPKILNGFKTKKDEYISGAIASSSSILQEKNYTGAETDTYIKLLTIIDMENSFINIFYKRKKIGILDVISKIGALFSTIRILFLFFFKYYSNNFNNYKIIQKILISNNSNNNTKIELSEEMKKSKDDQSNENKIKEENKIIAPLMADISDNKKLTINDDIAYGDNNEEIDDDENKPLKELPKYSFIHFFFNIIYFKKCFKIKKQEIINIYNEILFKYFSIDAILYNQIKLENLFKDYHWNNPSLNNLQNNNLIIKLKKTINS